MHFLYWLEHHVPNLHLNFLCAYYYYYYFVTNMGNEFDKAFVFQNSKAISCGFSVKILPSGEPACSFVCLLERVFGKF